MRNQFSRWQSLTLGNPAKSDFRTRANNRISQRRCKTVPDWVWWVKIKNRWIFSNERKLNSSAWRTRKIKNFHCRKFGRIGKICRNFNHSIVGKIRRGRWVSTRAFWGKRAKIGNFWIANFQHFRAFCVGFFFVRN